MRARLLAVGAKRPAVKHEPAGDGAGCETLARSRRARGGQQHGTRQMTGLRSPHGVLPAVALPDWTAQLGSGFPRNTSHAGSAAGARAAGVSAITTRLTEHPLPHRARPARRDPASVRHQFTHSVDGQPAQQRTARSVRPHRVHGPGIPLL